MKIISFVNQKGGSSKTTTASLFARSLCNDGKKVLIIDTDPQGGISSIYKSRSEIPNVKKETPNKGILTSWSFFKISIISDKTTSMVL